MINVKTAMIVETKPPISDKREKNVFAYVSICLYVGEYLNPTELTS